jgi:hypothetical protein
MADLDDRPTASPVERIVPLRLSVGQRARRATITNQDGTTVLEGECWTYTLLPE